MGEQVRDPWRVNRRRLLAGGAAAVAVGAAVSRCDIAQSATAAEDFGLAVEPFYGTYQSGVATAPQAHALFVALDVVPPEGRGPRETLGAVLKLLSADAARLTQGVPALADTEPELAQRPARLTVTVGLGPSVFDDVGLAHLRPDTVSALPAFPTDVIEKRWCGGDLLLQICADDPVAVAHTSRVLLKNVRTMTRQRWRQAGFRAAHGPARTGASMRNIMGQIDGTSNIRDDTVMATNVWDDGAEQPWFAGGTVVVVRRIRAEMDSWDELDRRSKELTVGRRLDTGAPLTGERQSDVPDLAASVSGIPVIPPNAHIALAHHRSADEQFLRRPYNFDDPPAAGQTTDTGLIFAAFQQDPRRQFVPVQQRLAAGDAMNQWITTIGSACFAVLPGAREGGYLGQSLLEA